MQNFDQTQSGYWARTLDGASAWLPILVGCGLAVLFAGSLVACNTSQGFGEDVESLGESFDGEEDEDID